MFFSPTEEGKIGPLPLKRLATPNNYVSLAFCPTPDKKLDKDFTKMTHSRSGIRQFGHRSIDSKSNYNLRAVLQPFL